MATAQQPNPELQSLVLADSSPTNLLSLALEHNAAIDVIERLAVLQEKMLARDAEIHFNQTLSEVQSKIARVAPDLTNSQTSSRYASYDAIDRKIRPIYTERGMSLSFSHGETAKPDHVRVLCFVSLGAHTRTYQIDMPCDGKGAKGGDVMTKTHATAAADSYAKRYLVKDIFNIAIGEDDSDGNDSNPASEGIPQERVEQLCSAISTARDMNELHTRYMEAGREAQRSNDRRALKAFIATKDARKAALR